MKKTISTLMIIVMFMLVGCTSAADSSEKIKVAVSIPPQSSIVKAIAGEYVEVITMIPPGYSPANYAPTQKEMAALESSAIYFGIDVPTELVNIRPIVEANDKGIKFVDLAERVDAVYPARYFDETHELTYEAHESHDHEGHDDHEDHEEHDHEDHGHIHEGRDPHIWLSAKRVAIMTEEIYQELVILMPEQADLFEQNKNKYLEDLKAVDDENEEVFRAIKNGIFLIYHPSLGYFAEEYNLKMIALESEGKSATVKGMTEIINFAKAEGITTVFYQEEFDSKQARLLAAEIGGQAVQLSPLNEDIVETLREMGKVIKNSMK